MFLVVQLLDKEVEIVACLQQVFHPVLVSITGDVFDDIALAEPEIIS